MYKYTYELSQSYRTETSNQADIYQSCKLYPTAIMNPRSSIPNQSLIKKVSHSQSKPNKEPSPHRFDIQQLSQIKNLQNIEVKRYQPYKKETAKEQPMQAQQYRKRNVYQPSENQSKIKTISDKYAHKTTFPLNNQDKKQQINQIDTRTQKRITEYAKEAPQFGKEVEKVQRQFNLQIQKPLKEANRTLKTFAFEENVVNRTKIRSEIAVYLHKSKQNVENIASASFQKKYDYGINKPAPIPVSDKQEQSQSNETVAKLTSLQQRIKSTVEPFIHF